MSDTTSPFASYWVSILGHARQIQRKQDAKDAEFRLLMCGLSILPGIVMMGVVEQKTPVMTVAHVLGPVIVSALCLALVVYLTIPNNLRNSVMDHLMRMTPKEGEAYAKMLFVHYGYHMQHHDLKYTIAPMHWSVHWNELQCALALHESRATL